MVIGFCAVLVLIFLLALIVVPAKILQAELSAYAEILLEDDPCREVP